MTDGEGERRVLERISVGAARRIAHDLRGPLQVIQGALREIEMAGGDVASYVEMARRGAKKIERIAGALDVVAHLEGPPTVAAVDLAPILDRAISTVRASERANDMQLHVPTGTTLRVRVSPTVFAHALEDVLAWCARRAQTVRIDVDEAAQIVVHATGVGAVPASDVPFDDALGLARQLFAAQDVTMDSTIEESALVIRIRPKALVREGRSDA